MSHASRLLVVLGCAAVFLSAGTPNPSAATGQPPAASAQPAAQSADTLRQREQQRVAALLAGDVDAVAAMLSPTLTYSHSNGTVDTRDAFVATLRSKQVVYKAVNHKDVQVRFPGPDVAILNGISDFDLVIGGQEQHIPLRFTMVYARQGGQWLLEAWHSARRQP